MEYKTGDLIFVSLTNATDGSIVQNANCTITVINGTVAAYANISMADAYDGTHYWSIPAGLVPQPNTPYRAKAICNTSTTAYWQDLTYFYVVDIHSPQRLFTLNATLNASIALLPKSCGSGSSNLTACGSGVSNVTLPDIWEYAGRNLTQNITQNFTVGDASAVASSVWAHAGRTLTQNITGNFTSGDAASVAAAVWSYATRSLTDFGTLIADIWAAVTRTLTSVSITNSTQAAQLENASANVTITTGSTTNNYNTDNSTMNIIIPEGG
jgi:hypothetical protein